MNTGQTLLDRAADLCGSRYKLAQRLGRSQGFLSDIALGKAPMPPLLAAELAAIVGDDPRTAALDALSNHEKEPAKRRAYKQLFRLAAAQSSAIAVATSLLALSPASNDAQAKTGGTDPGLCIMSNSLYGNR